MSRIGDLLREKNKSGSEFFESPGKSEHWRIASNKGGYKLKILITLFSLFFSLTVSAQSKNIYLDLKSMIETEYAFSAKSAEVGTRDAFLAFIADDGILFRPGPVNGREFLIKTKYRPGVLSWYPAIAKISSSGDMGFTTGPWEFKNKAEDSSASYLGNFCTVWKKQSDGNWKFVIDYGTSNDKPGAIIKPYDLKNEVLSAGEINSGSHEITILKDLDTTLGLSNLEVYTSGESRFLRDGNFPAVGIGEIKKFFEKEKIKDFISLPAGGMISSVGDFGFTYGIAKCSFADSADKKFNYMRVWMKNGSGEWKILSDTAVQSGE